MNLKPLFDLIQFETNKSDFFISASKPIQLSDEEYFNEVEVIREEFRDIVGFVSDQYGFASQEKINIVQSLIESNFNNLKVQLIMNTFGVSGFEEFFVIKGIYCSQSS